MSGFAPRVLRQLALSLISGLLLAPGSVSSSDQIQAQSDVVDPRIRNALDILSHTPTGKLLLSRAQSFWKLSRPQELGQKLKWGAASKTDAVLTRHFNPRTGQESRERQVTVFLRHGQTLDDLVLDIAHELVHATSRPSWDPYDSTLTPGRYIWAAIEGEGGEVKAVAMECQVGFEIKARYGAAAHATDRCRGYVTKSTGQAQAQAQARPSPDAALDPVPLDEEKIRRDFYRVGHWGRELGEKLGSELALFPLLSRETPRLYSSTGNAPYPIALYREFEEITQIACENSRRRVEAESARAPAGLQKSAAAFIARRCDKRS